MSLPDFLDVIYADLADRADNAHHEKGKIRPRTELDNTLGVMRWPIPGVPQRRINRPNNAPEWWVDDQDASQVFLRSVGAVIPDG